MLSSLASYRRNKSAVPISATVGWLNQWDDPKALRRLHEFDAYWHGATQAAVELGYRLEEFVVGPEISPERLHSILLARGVRGLLLLNQFPDVEADRQVGRRHLPMLWGRRRAAALLAALLLGAHATLAWGVAAGALGGGAALGLLSAPLAAWVAWGAWRHADDLPALMPTMGRNVLLCLCTPLLVALGLVLWR
jgi:hypothetical protein